MIEETAISEDGPMNQRPAAIGLLLCEQVIVEEKTRNVTPVNCFTYRTAERFPRMRSFTVFAILTDGLGEISLEIALQRLDTLDEVYRRRLAYRFTNPLQEVRFLLRIRDCSFPVLGHYLVTLLADNELVAQRRLRILPKEHSP